MDLQRVHRILRLRDPRYFKNKKLEMYSEDARVALNRPVTRTERSYFLRAIFVKESKKKRRIKHMKKLQ